MKFLVTGSAGLVGRQVVYDIEKGGDTVYSIYHESKPENGIATQIDITCFEKIQNLIEKINPDVIIHLAAFTNVDQCEKEKNCP